MDTVTFGCTCGKSLRVDKNLAGKMARCPACGATVQIPASDGAVRPTVPSAAPPPRRAQPKPASAPRPQTSRRPSSRSSSRTRLGCASNPNRFSTCGLICGCLLLATLIMPWVIARSRVIMSWNFLARAPGSVQVTFILIWIIGAGAIAISIFLRGRYAHMSHGLLGMAGILIWVIQLTGRRSAGDMAGIRSALGAVEVFYIIFLLATIVATIVRLRLSPTLIIRIVQGFCASVFVIFALVALIYSISRYTDLPKSYGSKMLFDFMFGLLLQLALIASGIVAVIHAAAIKIRSKTLSQTSLYLSFGALMCFFGYLIIGPAIASRQSEMILLMTNMVLLVAPLVIMFCAGLTGFICSILTGQSASHVAATSPTASPAPAPAPAPGGGSVQERLRKLSELQQQGLITDKEYADKRAEILDGL